MYAQIKTSRLRTTKMKKDKTQKSVSMLKLWTSCA